MYWLFSEFQKNALVFMGLRRPNKASRSPLARRVDSARRQRGYSLKELARQAGYDDRTIRNFMDGKPIRPRTKIDICAAVGIDVKSERGSKRAKRVSVADSEHGAYTKELFRDYIGSFFAYRYSFQTQENLVRSLYDVFWSDEANCLRFRETHRYRSPRLGRIVN